MADEWKIEQVSGLDLSTAAKRLRAIDPQLPKQLRAAMAKDVQAMRDEAKARARVRPGGGTYKRNPGAIRAGASPTKASVWIGYPNPSPTSLGAEYGAKRAWVFGRTTIQGKLRRRQYPVWRGNQWTVRGSSGAGWIVMPVIRARFPAMEKAVTQAIDDVIADALTRL